MDADELRAVVEAIPPGHWMSYADVVAAAGGEPAPGAGGQRAPDAAGLRRARTAC